MRIKSLRTLEKLAIRNYQILTIKTGPTVHTVWCLALWSPCRVGVEDDPPGGDPVCRLVCEIPV